VRVFGILAMLVGLAATAFGSFYGFQTLFTWNGRHMVDTRPLDEGATHHVLVPVPGRRYTIAVQAIFDRERVELREGSAVVEAQLPLVLRVTDKDETRLTELSGWLDPNAPPNVLYGQNAKPSAHAPELAVERLSRPFNAASAAPLAVDVDLGADRLGGTPIVRRRLVIYDDQLPETISRAFLLAGVGAFTFLVGLGVSLVAFFRRRKRKRTSV